MDNSPTREGSASSELSAATYEEVLENFTSSTSGGVEILVKRNGSIVHAVSGEGSADGGKLATGSSFRVGSIAKPFIAVLTLQLVDEGSIDLDATLDTYLPDTEVGANSSIRQLLSHQSGLPDYTKQANFFSDVTTESDRRFTPPEILSYVKNQAAGPAGQFGYSNTNYILLGQLIEHLDNTDLNTSLRTRIVELAGLESTFFDTPEQSLPEDMTGGWSQPMFNGDPSAEYTAISTSAWAAGSLISTTTDLATFLEALNTGRLTSAESLAEMTTFGPGGYGLGLNKTVLSPTQTGYGHSGAILGYTSTMTIEPSTGYTLVILTNSDSLVADQLAPQLLAIEH